MNYLFHNIGNVNNRNYHKREQFLGIKDSVVTFDGIYRNVWENRDVIRTLLDNNNKVILFVSTGFVGGNNMFDIMPYEQFATWDQIMELVMMGCKLGHHTITHRDLTKLNDDELEKEIKPPFNMDYFAYPYGYFNDRVINVVKKYYKEAFVVFTGDDSPYQITRKML